MDSKLILTILFLGMASANVMKRQAVPSPTSPPLPPTKTDAVTSGAPIMMSSPTAPDTQPPPPPSSSMAPAMDSTTQPPMSPASPSVAVVSSTPQATPMMPDTTPIATDRGTMSTMMVTQPSSSPDAPITTPMMTTVGTTKKPTIDELVSVDEILDVFGNVATSDFFRKLPFEDQLLVMEILAGGETGQMTAILEQVETKHLLYFMYNLPFKYVDPLWRIIDLGYTREEIISQ